LVENGGRITPENDFSFILALSESDTLFSFPETSIAIQLFPGTASFQPVKGLQDIAIEAVSTALPEEQVITAPIVTALRLKKKDATDDKCWWTGNKPV
jgi:hypothetical protein